MKRIGRRVFLIAATAAALLVASALVPTSITPAKNPPDARAVFVIDHGTHSSLAIETVDGQLLRYSYGDFRYYATRDTSLASGAAALFWPTEATLGRGELAGPASEQILKRQLVVVVETIHSLKVAGDRADQLIAKLDAIYLAGRDELVAVPAYGLIFAPHPTNYFLTSNSSTMVGIWLRELGVEIFGWALVSSWSLGTS